MTEKISGPAVSPGGMVTSQIDTCIIDYPKITEGISFESYPSTKKFLSCVEDPKGEAEVKVNGVATFKVKIFQISKFIVGGLGEPYCKIPIKSLKLLNKFLGTTINN